MGRCQEIPQARVAAQARHERGSVKHLLRTALYTEQQITHPHHAQTTQLNSLPVCPIHAEPVQHCAICAPT